MADRVTQEVTEVLRNGQPAARVTQVVVEVLRNRPPVAGGLTQMEVEVLGAYSVFTPQIIRYNH
jgi:ribosomal protein S28E/S33